MIWRILGPVEGEQVRLRRPQQRGVLGFLLLNAGQVVTIEQLMEALWAGSAPSSARTQVHACISQIRHALRGTPGEGRLASELGGYRIVLADADDLDLAVFTRLVARARSAKAAGRLVEAVAELRDAMAQWRGAALTGASGAFVAAAAAALQDKQLAAYEELFDLELALGRQASVVAELQPLVSAHPLRERLIAQLMLALAGRGQQAQAVDLYAATRTRLAEQLGMSPSAELTAAHLRVLRQDLPEQPGASASSAAVIAPAQLPADLDGFSGRATQLRELDEMLGSGELHTVAISAIDGTAGVGKTALAIHWAHRIAGRFPDGQLYVNLRGFDPQRAPMTSAEAIRGFLDTLHVPPHRLPASLEAQTALYRSVLAGKRMLVLLDNARDTGQVRPLLPGTGGCLVIITSRNRLTGLIASAAGRPLTLDLLSTSEAVALLNRRLGPARLAAEPDATRDIIDSCAHLPLALSVAAARAATQPHLPLATLAQQLRETLSTLDTADPATDVRTVFSWSYRALTPAAAQIFRLLGLHPGPDAAAPALASLADQPVDRIRSLLAELTSANLVSEPLPGRYATHDLLCAYAAELAHRHDDEHSRNAALQRLLDHYLHTAHTAATLLYPYRETITLARPQPGTRPVRLPDHRHALEWLMQEHKALLAAIEHAAESGLDEHAWRLAWALWTFLDMRGHWHDLAHTQTVALQAATRLGDWRAQAIAHRYLARACQRTGRIPDAQAHLKHALDLYTELGDRNGEGHVHHNMSLLHGMQGNLWQALSHATLSLRRSETSGTPSMHAQALNQIGWCHAHLGNYEQALEHCQQAVSLLQRAGNRHGQAGMWVNLGYAHQRLGDHDRAASCHRRALDLYQDLGDRWGEADTLVEIGDVHSAAGDTASAHDAWRLALAILTELDHPSAIQVEAKLAGVSNQRGAG